MANNHGMPIPTNSPSPCPMGPASSPSSNSRHTGKRKSHVEVSLSGESIAMVMSKQNEIACVDSHVAREEFEIEQYKKAISVLKALPGYNEADPMYVSALSFFLKTKIRRLWLALGDDLELTEQWLRGYWNTHGSD